MRVARAQALRAALTPRASLHARAAAAPPLARRASAAHRAPLPTQATHARALLPGPPLRRAFCGDATPLTMAPRSHLRPRGIAVAAVAGLGVAAAGARVWRGVRRTTRCVRRVG
jgi:hypothetical protein